MTASIVPVAPRHATGTTPAGTALPVPEGAAGGHHRGRAPEGDPLAARSAGGHRPAGAVAAVWALDQSPPSLDPDEVSIGYNAWSLARTGRDEYGHTPPLTFRAFGEYKRLAYIYAAVPGLALLGPTPHAVRLPAAVFGALSVPLLYGVAVLLLRSWRAGLCGALLLAVSPWHLQFTRPRGRPACWCWRSCCWRTPCSRPGTPAPRSASARPWHLCAGLAFLLALYDYPGPPSSPRSSSSSWPAATGGASCGPPASGSRRGGAPGGRRAGAPGPADAGRERPRAPQSGPSSTSPPSVPSLASA